MENMLNLIDERFHTAENGQIYESIISHIERMVILKALERSYGNQVMAAKILGLHRNTLSNKIKKFDIDVGRFKK